MHEINRYITQRYDRWLDYSKYHCGLSGIPDEAMDVLNEVLCSLLQKDKEMLIRLLNTKKNGYSELDFFVLKMIKLNASSMTSPYRSKYKSITTDNNIDYTKVDVEDVIDDDLDEADILLGRFRKVRDAFDDLDLSPLAKQVFEFRFFNDHKFSEWEGSESIKDLYDIYNGVQELIRKKINCEILF